MMVREHGGQLMIVFQAQDGFLAPEALEAEMKALLALLESFDAEGVRVASAFFQLSSAVHHGMDPKAETRSLFGPATLTEELEGLHFEISPGSFFQVNKPATLVLYRAIKDAVLAGGAAEDTVLLDLCCGTGTIGMMMAPHVGRVIGVELVAEAVEDAKRNATANSIANIEFICAKVEDALPGIISSLPPTARLAVVLDPPRCGVHKSVIRTLRNTSRIDSLVFVACNPKACLQNFADLGKEVSRSTTGMPFALHMAQPVDMFPMTEHCELILKFDRAA
jgi:tRNA (uracil-5-)-methyltransferase